MAAVVVSVSCPACKKTFKGKADLEGKKIRCPACEEPFVVRLGGAAPAKGPAAKKPAAEKPPQAPPPAPAPPPVHEPGEDEDDPNPYGVNTHDLGARCPNCANPMESEEAVICLFCGYNTQTRTLGTTKKVIESTRSYHWKWLAPGLACAAGLLVQIVGCLYYCLVLPYKLQGTWFWWLDHESLRLWLVAFALFEMWPMGIFAFNRLILHPTPKEIEKD